MIQTALHFGLYFFFLLPRGCFQIGNEIKPPDADVNFNFIQIVCGCTMKFADLYFNSMTVIKIFLQ